MASPILPSNSKPSYITAGISVFGQSPPATSKKSASNKLLFRFLTKKISPKYPSSSANGNLNFQKSVQTSFTSFPAFISPSYFKFHLSASVSGCASERSTELSLYLTIFTTNSEDSWVISKANKKIIQNRGQTNIFFKTLLQIIKVSK